MAEEIIGRRKKTGERKKKSEKNEKRNRWKGCDKGEIIDTGR